MERKPVRFQVYEPFGASKFPGPCVSAFMVTHPGVPPDLDPEVHRESLASFPTELAVVVRSTPEGAPNAFSDIDVGVLVKEEIGAHGRRRLLDRICGIHSMDLEFDDVAIVDSKHAPQRLRTTRFQAERW